MKPPLSFAATSRAASRSDSRGIRNAAGHSSCPRSSNQAGNATHSAAPQATRTVYINQASQAITWPDPPTPIDFANNLTFSLTASGGESGNPIVFGSSTPTRCTVSGNIVSVVSGNGQCTLTANQAGNTNYAAAPTELRYVYINKGDQTISFDLLPDRPQTPNTFTVTATATSGLAVSFQSQTTAKCTVSGTTVTLIATGTCTVRARQTGNGNWVAAANVDRAFTISAGSQSSQTITFATLPDKTMGEAPFSISAAATSGLAVVFTSATPATCTATGANGATITLIAAGTCTLNANQAGNASYLPAAQVTRSFTIAAQGQVYFIHADHLGTPRTITRPSDNQVVWKWDAIDSFGNNPPNENPSGLGVMKFPLRHPGQYADDETGTFYNYYRDFDPATGRYIQSDPIGLKGGLNTYSYVRADPLRFIDSLGLYSSEDVIRAWNQYCDGTGADWTTSFSSINWGDARSRISAKIKGMVGNRCKNMTIPVNFDTGAQTEGADAYIIGRHVLRTKGTLKVNCDCSWKFTGNIASALGYDPYDFDASNRGLKGEVLTWIGRNRCPESGKPFNINITGSEPLNMSGQVEGATKCECGQ